MNKIEIKNRKLFYNLTFHERITLHKTEVQTVTVVRVPGGWLYEYWHSKKNILNIVKFIPFNNEFNLCNHQKPFLKKVIQEDVPPLGNTLIYWECDYCDEHFFAKEIPPTNKE